MGVDSSRLRDYKRSQQSQKVSLSLEISSLRCVVDIFFVQSCTHHGLHVIYVPFPHRSPMSCYTAWVHGLDYLRDCFHHVSITLGLSDTLSLQRHSKRIWPRLFLITVTVQWAEYEPCEKTTFCWSQSVQRHGTGWQAFFYCDSRLSLHQSLASMSSLSTRWFTGLLIITSHAAAD